MLVPGCGLSGSCQRPWGSSSCDRPDSGKMTLEEVRKLTLTFSSDKSLPVCGRGQAPGVLSFTPAEQTKHSAHLAFSYFINGSSLRFLCFSNLIYLPFLQHCPEEATLKSWATACCGGYAGNFLGKRTWRTLWLCRLLKQSKALQALPHSLQQDGGSLEDLISQSRSPFIYMTKQMDLIWKKNNEET